MRAALAGWLRRLAYRLDGKPAVAHIEVIYDTETMFDAVKRYHEAMA